MYKILNGLGIVLLLLLMAAGVFLYLTPHFGWQVEAVRSSSMAPEIQRGTLVFSKPVDTAEIEVNDILIVRQPAGVKALLCHRVVEITNLPVTFRTKGDALIDSDPFLVPERDVVGRVFFHIHVLGYPVMYMKTPVGFVMTMAVPGMVVIFMCLANIRSELRKDHPDKAQRKIV